MTANSKIKTSDSKPAGSGVLSNLRLVSLGTVISRVFGLIRDISMTSLFGAGTIMDAFILAFRIPNLARQLLGEGALATAFLPVYMRTAEKQGPLQARQTLSVVLFTQAALLSGLLIIAELAIATVCLTVDLSESSRLFCGLLAIMLPYGVLICTSAVLCAALQAHRQFFWPAYIPVLFNVVCLASVILVTKIDLTQQQQIIWLAFAVVFAGFFQVLVPFWSLQRQGLGVTRSWGDARSGLQEIIQTMMPILIGMSVLQIGILLDSVTAWTFSIPDDGSRAWCEIFGIQPFLESGTASAMYLGQRLLQFPVGIFGIALGSVLYPVLTRHAQLGEMDGFRQELTRGVRLSLSIGIPASVGLALIAKPLTIALFRWGEFSAEDAQLTAQMIQIYSLGVWCSVSLAVLNRAWFAAIDRTTPMKIGLWILVLNQFLVFSTFWWGKGASIAAGSVIANMTFCLVMLVLLSRRLGKFEWSGILSTLVRTAISTLCMAISVICVFQVLPEPAQLGGKLVSLGLPCLVGGLTYGLSAWALGMRELPELLFRKE